MCQQPNYTLFVLNPPTAGLRKLELRGTAPDQLLRFLRDLQLVTRPIGAEIPLHDYFDVVEASETGKRSSLLGYKKAATERETNDKKDMFRLLALFIEHGRLGNCRHSLPQSGRSKADTKMRLPRAKRTSRKLAQVWQYNGLKISWNPNEKVFSNVQHFKCVILRLINRLPCVFADINPSRTAPCINGFSPRYYGEACSSPQSRQAAKELFCSLFYIELRHLPRFYTSPDTCVVGICCRMQPGPTLFKTLAWLYTNRIRIKYKGDELSLPEAVLCTENALRKCWDGVPFCRTITVTAYSPNTLILLQLGPFDGRFYDISSSPYKLGHLVQHQEQGWLMNSQQPQRCDQRIGGGFNKTLPLELNRLIEAVRLTL